MDTSEKRDEEWAEQRMMVAAVKIGEGRVLLQDLPPHHHHHLHHHHHHHHGGRTGRAPRRDRKTIWRNQPAPTRATAGSSLSSRARRCLFPRSCSRSRIAHLRASGKGCSTAKSPPHAHSQRLYQEGAAGAAAGGQLRRPERICLARTLELGSGLC